MIPEVVEELGFYHSVSVSQHFIMENGLDKRKDQLGVDPDPDEEECEDVVLDDERERQWRMVSKDNNGEVGGKKASYTQKKVGCLKFGEGDIGKGWVFG